MNPQTIAQDAIVCPRVTISALRGGSGKTIVSLGIIAALKGRGKRIAPFKKGPDYIDAGWLALAAGRPCFNLDTFLVSPERVFRMFRQQASAHDMALIEGNRGLFDGIDMAGSTSTAELAKLLQTPVVLCIDCTKSTRTMAAVVLGCGHFDPQVNIQGVILNRVAGPRHENILRNSIEHHCGYPVVGAIPKLKRRDFPERHMGLTPIYEHGEAPDSVAAAGNMAARYIDLEAVERIAGQAPALAAETDRQDPAAPPRRAADASRVRIGVIRDSAFQFYYPENLDALKANGAELVFCSPLAQETLPAVDGLYIGGGFPETHADTLAANQEFRQDLYRRIQAGFPVYAECGGLMYLGRELVLEGRSYSMAGVLPVTFGLSKRPRGHGYTIVRVEHKNPYYAVGSEIRGHEFHYSHVLEWQGNEEDLIFSMQRGTGFYKGRDGVRFKNVLATYTHTHALGTPQWARSLVRQAAAYRKLLIA